MVCGADVGVLFAIILTLCCAASSLEYKFREISAQLGYYNSLPVPSNAPEQSRHSTDSRSRKRIRQEEITKSHLPEQFHESKRLSTGRVSKANTRYQY